MVEEASIINTNYTYTYDKKLPTNKRAQAAMRIEPEPIVVLTHVLNINILCFWAFSALATTRFMILFLILFQFQRFYSRFAATAIIAYLIPCKKFSMPLQIMPTYPNMMMGCWLTGFSNVMAAIIQMCAHTTIVAIRPNIL